MFSVESQGAIDVMTPLAPISQENVSELLETVEKGLSAGQPMLVLNMNDVPLVDSAGLEAMLDIQDSLQRRGGTVKWAAVSQLCQEILRITGVAEHFETYQDVKSAVGSYVK